MESSNDVIGDILHAITSRKEWYSKIFDDVIVKKWKTEFVEQSKNSGDLFDFVISLARTTAQGVKHEDDCSWDEGDILCDTCLEEEKQTYAEDNPNLTPVELTEIFNEGDWLYELEIERCEHKRCRCTPPDSELTKYIQHNNKIIPKRLHNNLKIQIYKMLEREPVDWHPGSNEQVRDLIHPSMYCYVRGISALKDGHKQEPCEENIRYQWMPSEFSVHNKKVKITSYVNNLDDEKYPNIKPLLEKTFSYFLEPLETVLKTKLPETLQVIVKIGTIILKKSNPKYPGGSWHIEGMPYEHIIATCIHYVDVSGITDSYLEFRKPVIIDNEGDLDYPQSDGAYTTHHYGITEGSHHEGQMNRYLGLIKCDEGSSVVFPNALQHKVKDFSLKSTAESSTRTILAFFVIDPKHKITSTSEIPKQQKIMKRSEAEHHRERLMFHRKYFVNRINEQIFEREYSLCEH